MYVAAKSTLVITTEYLCEKTPEGTAITLAVKKSISEDGVLVYEEYRGENLLHKKDSSPLSVFLKWLLDKETNSRCNICCNGSDSFNPIGERRLKGLNFKQKLFYVLFKKLLLSKKATVQK